MNAALIALLLASALLLGGLRSRHHGAPHRVARIALQGLAALLLWLCLFPPATREEFAAAEMAVLTPGISVAQRDALPATAALVALPGVAAAGRAERVPDLGTALRRHPEVRRLRIVGGGLPVRDRDAARGLVAAFDAAPLPRGVVELALPSAVIAGSMWRVGGRVADVSGGRIELRDPSAAMVADAALDAQGRFAFAAPARAAGPALFRLRVRDGAGRAVEDLAVPLAARAGSPLRVLLLAGAPDPELKYLRRWVVDAGMQLDSQLALSKGIALTEGDARVDAAALREADVAIIDDRAWSALDRARKEALVDAVHDGLGLLLRVTGPVPSAVLEDWRALGFGIARGDAGPSISLTRVLDLADAAPGFTRFPLMVDAPDAAPLLRADDATPLALWRAEGQGRVALWWLADSWRLELAGASARYATLWGEVTTTLARARGMPGPSLPSDAWVDQRAVLCGVGDRDRVEAPGGKPIALIVDPAAAHAGPACAGYWPAEAGWHTLVSGGMRWPFYVRDAGAAAALAAGADARATRALVSGAGARATATREVPLPRWPFFIGWLAVVGVLWWLERRGVRAIDSPLAASQPPATA